MSAGAWLGLLAAGLSVALLAWLAVLFRGGGAEEPRRSARRRGLEVDEVTRETPVSYDRGRSWQLETRPCVRYSRPAPEASVPEEWALLQRPDEHHPPLPEGWRIDPGPDALPEPLRHALADVAAEWREEFLELEGDTDRIHAYWEEWGGRAGVDRVAAVLDRVTEALETAR